MSFLYRRLILRPVKVLEAGNSRLEAGKTADRAGSRAAAAAARGGVRAGGALFQALVEADGSADEVESGAEAIFEEALVAEVQRLGLVGEEDKGGWSCGGL